MTCHLRRLVVIPSKVYLTEIKTAAREGEFYSYKRSRKVTKYSPTFCRPNSLFLFEAYWYSILHAARLEPWSRRTKLFTPKPLLL